MLKRWRRRVRGRLTLFTGLLVLGIVLPMHIAAAFDRSAVYWAGLSTGAVMTMVLSIRESPPGYIQRWQLGAWGEQATAKALRPLERGGWTVLHDRRIGSRRGNVDHLLVGAAGVFLLDSKRWSGITTVSAGVASVARHEDPDLPSELWDRLPASVRGAAAGVHARVKEVSRIHVFVKPVVVVWGEFPQREAAGDGFAYLHGDELVRWLRAQPLRLQPDGVTRIAGVLQQSTLAA